MSCNGLKINVVLRSLHGGNIFKKFILYIISSEEITKNICVCYSPSVDLKCCAAAVSHLGFTVDSNGDSVSAKRDQNVLKRTTCKITHAALSGELQFPTCSLSVYKY